VRYSMQGDTAIFRLLALPGAVVACGLFSTDRH
jgi:hypothetical protein